MVYQIGASVPTGSDEIIRRAIREWEATTVVRFREAVSTVDRLSPRIVTFHAVDAGCYATVGNFGRSGGVWLSRTNMCGLAVLLHEIGHTIGLYHEHQRHDRDDHLEVLMENVLEEHRGNFDMLPPEFSLGDYNQRSIMHYANRTFGKAGGGDTMRSRITPGEQLGSDTITPDDASAVNMMYAGAHLDTYFESGVFVPGSATDETMSYSVAWRIANPLNLPVYCVLKGWAGSPYREEIPCGDELAPNELEVHHFVLPLVEDASSWFSVIERGTDRLLDEF